MLPPASLPPRGSACSRFAPVIVRSAGTVEGCRRARTLAAMPVSAGLGYAIRCRWGDEPAGADSKRLKRPRARKAESEEECARQRAEPREPLHARFTLAMEKLPPVGFIGIDAHQSFVSGSVRISSICAVRSAIAVARSCGLGIVAIRRHFGHALVPLGDL